MNRMVKILIVDENEQTRKFSKEELSRKGYLNVEEASNGEEAYFKIVSNYPDIVITDAWLSKIDGIGLIRKVMNLNFTSNIPKFILVSYANSNTLFMEATDAGASVCLSRPYDVVNLCDHINSLYQNRDINNYFSHKKYSIEEIVTETMHAIGIPTHLKGFQYLRSAIIMAVEDISTVNSITKSLYPVIAKKYDTLTSRVERGIRHAIGLAWSKGGKMTYALNSFFGFNGSSYSTRPTNSEFIATIADSIRIKYKKDIVFNDKYNFVD